MEKKTFDKKEYDKTYHQEHKDKIRQWKADLSKEEKEKYDEILKRANMSKVSFIRKYIKILEKEIDK